MENRLCLNKRPKYELPDEVLVGEYRRTCPSPKFEPDICITTFGNIEVKDKEATCLQIWIKTDNKDLIEFIEKYDWDINQSMTFNSITKTDVEKIILEEFYGVKYGE